MEEILVCGFFIFVRMKNEFFCLFQILNETDIRSAHLSQFIIHRGLIISFIQAVFSSLFYFAAVAIYNVKKKKTFRCGINH